MAKIAWTNSQGGSWTTAADWSGGVVPGAADDVTIAIAPPAGEAYEIDIDNLDVALHSLTLNQASATVSLLSSQLATYLILDAGTVNSSDSSLSGRIYDTGQGTLSTFFGTLTAERMAGTILLDAQYTSFAGGLTLLDSGTSQGTLALQASNLALAGSQAWNGGTIKLAPSPYYNDGTITLQSTGSGAVTFTLGTSLDLISSGDNTIGDGPTAANLIVNDGSISGTSGTLTLQEGRIFNAGGITAGAGSAIDILAGTLTNRGTITASAGGTLALDAAVVLNRGAIDIAGGTFALEGSDVSVATFKAASYTDGGIGAIEGAVQNSGDRLLFGTGGLPPIELAAGGAIAGGTLEGTGGLTCAGGSLNGVTFKGALDLSETSASVTLIGGLAGGPARGAGLGTIMLTGLGSALALSGTGTLSGVSIDAGAAQGSTVYGAPSGSTIEVGGPEATVYTLAAGSTLTQTGAILTIEDYPDFNPTTPEFINRGAIVATDATGTLSVGYLSFLNAGSILVGGGEQMIISGGDSFANTGSFTVAALGNVTMEDPTFSNSGKISVASGGTFQIDAQLDSSALGSLSVAAGGTLIIGYMLNNTGNTLRLGAGSAISLLDLAGEIQGGTIVAGSGGLFANGGSLYDVTFEGLLSVGGPGEASLNIGSGDSFTGANGSGAGSLLLTGTAASIDFLYPGPVDDVSITLASASSTLAGGNYIDNSVLEPLVLGSSVQITQTGEAATFGVEGIQTAATIEAAVAGGTFTLTGTIVNTGTIAISNGETLVLADNGVTNSGVISLTGGVLQISGATLADVQAVNVSNSVADVTGLLDLQTGTLNLSNDGLSLFRVGRAVQTYGYYNYGALIQSGTIIDPNGLLQVAGYAAFEGVTYEGTLDITRPLATLDLTDGSSVTDATGKLAGTIVLTGAGTTLDTDTLDNATIDIGSAGLAYDGNTLAPATLEAGTLGAHIVIDQTGAYAGIFEQSDDGSVLTSAATIEAWVAGGVLGIWGDAVTSGGSIGVSNGETVTIGSAEFVNTGVMSVAGAGSAVTLDTYAYYATDVFAASSFANAGTLLLSGGSFSQITGGGAFPELPIANDAGARISGFGSIGAAVANEGVVEASGGTLVLTQAVTGTGTLQVDAGATLQLAGVGAGGIADFSGTGGVLGLAPMSFLGTIEGFASGDTIDLAGTVASAASFAHDSIVVTLTAGGTITLATSTTLAGSITVTAGGHGDTLLTYASSGAHHSLFSHSG